ncbi:MAG: hypothetical protein JKY46_10535 [Robiginitomaculum sp.]|nr:hypothetical protein [Robiginitomaculum sp.]
MQFDGFVWQSFTTSIDGLNQLQGLGVGTDYSVGNPVSMVINNALFAAKNTPEGGTGDLRLTLNKQTQANTLSLLYQSNWVGKAEIGLVGNDDFAFRVSADGSQFKTALLLEQSSAKAIFPNGIEAASINDGPLNGFRNVIINGNFSIAQRANNSSASNTPSAIDRWYYFGGQADVSRQNMPTGELGNFPVVRHFARFDVQTKTTWQAFCQRIENVRVFSNMAATISFFVRAATATNLHIYCFQNFGIGGDAQITLQPLLNYPISTSWQKLSHTFQIPDISGKTIGQNSYLLLALYANTSTAVQDGNIDFANVQFEPGPISSEFEVRPTAIEQQLCYRYYRKMDIHVSANTSQLATMNMRSTPSIAGGGTGFSPIGTNAQSLIAAQTTAGVQSLELNAEI